MDKKATAFPKFYIDVPMPDGLDNLDNPIEVKIPVDAEYDHVEFTGSVTIKRGTDVTMPNITGSIYRLSPYGTIKYDAVDADDWDFRDPTDVWFEDNDGDSEVHLILQKGYKP